MKAYPYADWANRIDERKVTFGVDFFLGKYFMSWVNKKQAYISLSTDEVEYVVDFNCCTQIIWMKKNLKYIEVELNDTIPIMCDNTSAINIPKDLVIHSNTKHIPIKLNFLREQVATNFVRLEYVATKDKLEDIFTKPLEREPNDYLK